MIDILLIDSLLVNIYKPINHQISDEREPMHALGANISTENCH